MVQPADARPKLAEAERMADGLTDIYSSPPIPCLDIAEENGVNVYFTDFGKHAETVSGLLDFSKSRLYVNENDIFERQSFTIAHELGHWLLHKGFYEADSDRYKLLPRFRNPDRDDPLEQEANRFAACLLVPTRLLLPVVHAPVFTLSKIFGVSRTMMERRIKDMR